MFSRVEGYGMGCSSLQMFSLSNFVQELNIEERRLLEDGKARDEESSCLCL